MLKTYFRGYKQYQIDHKKQAVDLAVSNNSTLVDLAVIVYSIHIDCKEEW